MKLQLVRADVGDTGYCGPHDCVYRELRVPVSSSLSGGIVPRITSQACLVLIYMSTVVFFLRQRVCFWSKYPSCPCLFVLQLTLWTSLGAPENKCEELFWEHTNLIFSPRDQAGATPSSISDVLFKNKQPSPHICSFNFKCLAPYFFLSRATSFGLCYALM